jgi:hypothetical protein
MTDVLVLEAHAESYASGLRSEFRNLEARRDPAADSHVELPRANPNGMF